MEASPVPPSWSLAVALALVIYRFAMTVLLEAFRTLPSIQRRRMLEEGAIQDPRLTELLTQPHAFGLALNLWNQGLLIVLLGLLWPWEVLLPGGVGAWMAFVLFYLWLLDATLPSLLTAAQPAVWLGRGFRLYWPVAPLMMRIVGPVVRFVERRREHPERVKDESAEASMEEAVTALLEEGKAEGILEEEDRELIRNVVGFGDTVVREVMTPRTLIQGIDVAATYEEVAACFRQSRHSRLPVYEETVDHIVGILLLKDFLQLEPGSPVDLRTLAKPPLFVPESKPIPDLLRELQRARMQMAIVVDEFGSVSGLVTLEDLLEEVFGEIREEHESEGELEELPEGALLVSGNLHVEDLQARLGRGWAHEGYDTVAGLMMAHLGRVPQVGDEVVAEGARFIVLRMTGARVLQLRVEPGSVQEGEVHGEDRT